MNIVEIVNEKDFIVTVSDARQHFNGCIPGWKSFSDTHGFCWADVVRHGLLASQLLATDDAMATSLVEYVYNRDNLCP